MRKGQVNLNDLSPELRKKILEEQEAKQAEVKERKDAEARTKILEGQIARKGRSLLNMQQKSIESHDQFVKEAIEARDQIQELLGTGKNIFTPLGKTFERKDCLYKVEIVIRSVNKLDPVKSEQAKALLDEVISEFKQKEDMDEIVQELMGFLVEVFAKKKRTFTYNSAIHNFLARKFTDIRLIQAQDIIRDAFIASEPYYTARHWARESKEESYVLIPINYRRKAEVTAAVIQKRRDAKRAKAQGDTAVAAQAG